jgi:hypothetical protein
MGRTPVLRGDFLTVGATCNCQYCHKEIPTSMRFVAVIHGRNRVEGVLHLTEETREFCSAQCASHEQFSREG